MRVTYIVDLAESPTYDLPRRGNPSDEMRAWVGQLHFTSEDQPVTPHIDSIDAAGKQGRGESQHRETHTSKF